MRRNGKMRGEKSEMAVRGLPISGDGVFHVLQKCEYMAAIRYQRSQHRDQQLVIAIQLCI